MSNKRRAATRTPARPPASRPAPTAAAGDRRPWPAIAVSAAVVLLTAAGLLWWTLRGGQPTDGLAPLPGKDPGVAHVHGLGVDPADGTLYAATHHGLFRIPETGKATRVADRYQDTMGFTVVGPRHFLASGHPDQREDKPPHLGLIESTDAGETWRTLSLSGEADFHALEYRHGRVYGFDSTGGGFMVSTDKKTWDRRSKQPLADIAVSPADPDVVLATTEQGLARSSDGGRTFSAVAGAPRLLLVAWPVTGLLIGATDDGRVVSSSDGGRTWADRGRLPGRPEALTATEAQTVYAATARGIFASTDGGRTFRLRYDTRSQ